MYVTNYAIEELDTWFHGEGNQRYDFMFLIAAGGFYDDDLIDRIIDKSAIFHTITGKKTVFYLFTNEEDFILDAANSHIENRLKKNGDCCFNVGMTEFLSRDYQNEHRRIIKNESQTISSDICEYYNIPFENIPCFLILLKGLREPFVIRTKGAASVKSLYKFFRKLHAILKTVNGAVKDAPPEIIYGVLIKVERLCKEQTNKYIAFSIVNPLKTVIAGALSVTKQVTDVGKNIRDLGRKP